MPDPEGGSSLPGEAYLFATCCKCGQRKQSLDYLKTYSFSLILFPAPPPRILLKHCLHSNYLDLERYFIKVELQIVGLPNRINQFKIITFSNDLGEL